MSALFSETAMKSGAIFSPCRVYRYALWRVWGDGPSRLVVVGLNPSTADETVNDPTIRRCIAFANREGKDGLVMLNLFALRSTDPAALLTHPEPIGPDNDSQLTQCFRSHSDSLVAAWGSHKAAKARANAVLKIDTASVLRWVMPAREVMQCFGRTKDGSPKHPLYLRADAALSPLIGEAS